VRQRKQPPSSERLELEIEYTSEIMKAVNVEKMALRGSRVLPARLHHNRGELMLWWECQIQRAWWNSKLRKRYTKEKLK
jgi:hypothetical protein